MLAIIGAVFVLFIIWLVLAVWCERANNRNRWMRTYVTPEDEAYRRRMQRTPDEA